MTASSKKVIVIGAGAAGISAAIEASKRADVTVLEHTGKALQKLLVTGNGRCNFSNSAMDASHFHGDRKIIERVLAFFDVEDCLDFMKKCDVEPLEVHYRYNGNGYYYPSTNRAATVREGMLHRLETLGGKILYDTTVKGIIDAGDGYRILTCENEYFGDAVIFACGSNAAPETGSDSSVYPVLKEMNVRFSPFLPALTGIRVSGNELTSLSGMRCKAEVWLSDLTENRDHHTETGEIQFGDGYVSGIPVMQLSRYVSIGMKAGHEMILHMVPETWGNIRKDAVCFPEILHLSCRGTRSFAHAQCCTGGVSTEDLDPDTLGFIKKKGIYFCGEMIDVDGDCGGYNLHFAFGSGKLAGKAATE